LRDEAVYQNDREGFRFRVPQGWMQHAKSDLPPGKVNKEHLLVSYRRSSKPASLEVSLADLPESADLATYLAGPSFGAKHWRKNSTEEEVESQGMQGVRFTFTGAAGKTEMTKEVVVFRRGERVYFFTGLFAPGDRQSRDEIRHAVAGTTWNK
jgi:hypothetical protein